MNRVANVYVFANGMVMVFDEQGQQIPELQGKWGEKRDAILAAKPPEVEVHGNLDWREFRPRP